MKTYIHNTENKSTTIDIDADIDKAKTAIIFIYPITKWQSDFLLFLKKLLNSAVDKFSDLIRNEDEQEASQIVVSL